MQRQRQDRTVQGEVERALRTLDWMGDSILIAGRTDAGAHAAGQVIAFEHADWQHSVTKLRRALNAVLPIDISAREVSLVDETFHPRYDAIARRYRYQVFWSRERDPLRERYAWRIFKPMDAALMDAAAQKLVGIHDFKRFGAPTQPGGPTIRRMDHARWREQDGLIVLDIQANAFLYHMVRRIVRLCVQIGKGKWPLEWVDEYLEGKQEDMIQGLAAPEGLCLMEVLYPGQPRE
jgi:tRNA pseudouridine38-40 synthase